MKKLISKIISIAVFASVLTACETIEEIIEPEAKFNIAADHTINPNANGRPSPVVLHVYELKSKSLFEALDFFSIYDDAEKYLGPDLLSKKEYYLQPGDEVVYLSELDPSMQYVGFVAAFRDINNSNWRSVVVVDNKEQSEFQVDLNKLDITVFSKVD